MGASSSQSGVLVKTLEKKGAALQYEIRQLMEAAEDRDFYELFKLERYSGDDDPDGFKEKVQKTFRRLSAQYHPDKHLEDTKDEYTAMFKYIESGRQTLIDPERKRRYDLELRRKRDELTGWDAYRHWCRWIANVSLVAGGIGCIVGGLFCAVPTAGAGLGLSIAGSAMLTSGIKGCVSQWQDPEQSDKEYLKQLGVGMAAGAIGGAIGGACMGAIAATSCVGAQLGIAAACGSATALSSHLVEDVTDLATGSKSTEEVFNIEHGILVAKNLAIGACAGMAVQGVASHIQRCSGAGQIVDDAATAAIASGKTASRAAIDAGKAAKESVTKMLESGTTAASFCKGVGEKIGAQITGTACHTTADAIYTSALLAASAGPDSSVEEMATHVAQEAAIGLVVGTAFSVATSLAAQGAEHTRARAMLGTMNKPTREIGHGYDRHVGPIEMAEARAKANDASNGTRNAEGLFASVEQYSAAKAQVLESGAMGQKVVTVDMQVPAGISVQCVDGSFEYRCPTEVVGVKSSAAGSLKTLYPVHGGEAVSRSSFNTPLLRVAPGMMPNQSTLLHFASKAGAPSDFLKSEWAAVATEASKENCFVPRTRFLRLNGTCFDMVTAQEIKNAGGDVLLGPGNQLVTVIKAVKYGKATRNFVSISTPHLTRPFEITADHRLVVQGSGGCHEHMVAGDFARMEPEARPPLLCGTGFSLAAHVELIEKTECEVVAVTFAEDTVVWAWLLAEKRPKKGHGSSFSLDRAVACYGENQLRRDHIRRLFFEGAFRDPGLSERNTFLDFVSASTPQRSLSEADLCPHI